MSLEFMVFVINKVQSPSALHFAEMTQVDDPEQHWHSTCDYLFLFRSYLTGRRALQQVSPLRGIIDHFDMDLCMVREIQSGNLKLSS